MILARGNRGLAARDNLHDLQAVPGPELALGEFRRRHRLAVVLDHHAARPEVLGDQELLERAGELTLDLLPIGDDERALRG